MNFQFNIQIELIIFNIIYCYKISYEQFVVRSQNSNRYLHQFSIDLTVHQTIPATASNTSHNLHNIPQIHSK